MMFPVAVIPYWHPDPNLIHIYGNIWIRWYGLAYLTGFILGYWVLVRLARKNVLRMPAEWISDLVSYMALGVIVGGRAGWWIFYHVKQPGVIEPWYEPFALWHGGMSFHGGLIGVITVLILWTRSKKLDFANLADCMALVTPIGLCLGRLANYINGELWGRPTNVPWAMIFPSDPDGVPRHPSQLYEAFLEGPVLLAILWGLKSWKNRRDGQIAAMFVMGYGVLRFLVEFTREPDEQFKRNGSDGTIILGLSMGQLLSAGIVLVGVVWWVWLQLRPTADVRVVASPPSNTETK